MDLEASPPHSDDSFIESFGVSMDRGKSDLSRLASFSFLLLFACLFFFSLGFVLGISHSRGGQIFTVPYLLSPQEQYTGRYHLSSVHT